MAPNTVPSSGKFIAFYLLGAVARAQLAGDEKYPGEAHAGAAEGVLGGLSAACSLIAPLLWLPLDLIIWDATSSFASAIAWV